MEQYRNFYIIFMDLIKIFDTVSREGFWNIMFKFGCRNKFIVIICQFFEGMIVCVFDGGELIDFFVVINGVK